jgi:aconitate hydratase
MIDVRQRLQLPSGASGTYYSLPQLEKRGVASISRLPVSLRIILESVLRNLDGQRIRDEDVEALARWQPGAARTAEVPFIVGRVLLQDFTGVPLLVDLAAMRSAVARRGHDVARVQPLVPVDLVIDHSVQVDYFGRDEALQLNMEMEFRRNGERYRFLKWGAQAFDGLRIVPPGFGICHQVNLEFLARVVGKLVEFYGEGAASLSVPDRATLGNMAPEYGATIGFFPVDEQSCRYLQATGRSDEHVETVRRYFQAQGLFGMPERGQCDYTTVLDVGLGAVEPSVAGPKRPQDRIALDQLKDQFLSLLTRTDGFGKSAAQAARHVEVRLEDTAAPRPGGGEQSIETLPDGRARDTNTLTEAEMMNNRPTPNRLAQASSRPARTLTCELAHGDVVIASITSCTNTSNPTVMLAAGLLAKKAVERGLSVKPRVKTSLAPGASRRTCTSNVGTAGASRCPSSSGSTRRSKSPTSRRAASCLTCSNNYSPTRGGRPPRRNQCHDPDQAYV